IVILIAMGVIGVMLTFVIPKFEEMLSGTGQELPGPTKFVINLSHFITGHIGMIVGGIAVGGFLMVRFVKTKEGKAFVDEVAFKAPIFGPLVQRAGTARFTRTLATLLSSGVNLIEAIDICKATIDNSVLENAVGKIRGEIESGKTLGAVLARL